MRLLIFIYFSASILEFRDEWKRHLHPKYKRVVEHIDRLTRSSSSSTDAGKGIEYTACTLLLTYSVKFIASKFSLIPLHQKIEICVILALPLA